MLIYEYMSNKGLDFFISGKFDILACNCFQYVLIID